MQKFKSRKFWMAIIAGGLVIANQGLGLKIPEESVLSVAGIVMSYIFGQAYVDANKIEGEPLAPFGETIYKNK